MGNHSRCSLSRKDLKDRSKSWNCGFSPTGATPSIPVSIGSEFTESLLRRDTPHRCCTFCIYWTSWDPGPSPRDEGTGDNRMTSLLNKGCRLPAAGHGDWSNKCCGARVLFCPWEIASWVLGLQSSVSNRWSGIFIWMYGALRHLLSFGDLFLNLSRLHSYFHDVWNKANEAKRFDMPLKLHTQPFAALLTDCGGRDIAYLFREGSVSPNFRPELAPLGGMCPLFTQHWQLLYVTRWANDDCFLLSSLCWDSPSELGMLTLLGNTGVFHFLGCWSGSAWEGDGLGVKTQINVVLRTPLGSSHWGHPGVFALGYE